MIQNQLDSERYVGFVALQSGQVLMPFSHVLILCSGFIFGSLIAEALKASGLLRYAFFVHSIPGAQELDFAYTQVAVFCFTLLVGQRLLGGVAVKTSNWGEIRKQQVSKYGTYFLIVLAGYALFVTGFYMQDMLAEHSLRHKGNNTVSRLSLLIALLGTLVVHDKKYFKKLAILFVLIYIGSISGAIGASRSSAIPFLLASASFLFRRNYFTGVVFLYLALVALSTAFAVRGSPSFGNYWEHFFFAIFEFDIWSFVLTVFQYSFPGLATIQAAMYLPGELSLDSFFRFLLYLTPIPSSLLPKELFSEISLSYALGIDRNVLGINYDIFSEGIYWFGVSGAWVFTVTLGLIAMLPYYIGKRVLKSENQSVYLIILVTNFWMVFGGQVFNLRSGSRAVFAISILLALVALYRKTSFRKAG